MVMHKKAQSALEFLTTYGWAFLVILIMIGALSYFGVLDPSRFLPEKCLFGTGVGGCREQQVQTNSIVFVVSNNLGSDVTVSANGVVAVVGGANNCATPTGYYYLANPTGSAPSVGSATTSAFTWSANQLMAFSINCTTINTGERVSAQVNITYTPIGKNFAKVVQGEIQLRK